MPVIPNTPEMLEKVKKNFWPNFQKIEYDIFIGMKKIVITESQERKLERRNMNDEVLNKTASSNPNKFNLFEIRKNEQNGI
ncbi:hypothetical protein E4S40_10750 [Algoriphagus kandeliae]|uniref:Uncharacterized protein n=1 Tax=Algoriphagus kandeliae TaxID=2562278 RepID=A0A4Y9QS81_9BACT|nr:hypothetical protein [Algoriphagus kandeliae]TFV94492.1 hypothetical protein E4S40_10750 [Algoriphagus kandeliae]